jgi:hypothetical protein
MFFLLMKMINTKFIHVTQDPMKTRWIVPAICLMCFGCFTARPVDEVTLVTGRIILDTSQHYTPQVGDKTIIHIQYPLTSFNIHERIYADSIARFMNRFPNVVLEIGTHTDFRGTHEYNDTLSIRRSRSLTEKIIEKGIGPDRLIPVGHGENSPRMLEEEMYVRDFEATLPKGTHLTQEYIQNLPTRNEQEAAHYLNRRTVLVIVGMREEE